jgi:hypothetical protein
MQVLALAISKHKPTPTYAYQRTDWDDYRSNLRDRLALLPQPAAYDNIDALEEEVRMLEDAVRATTEEIVPLSKPYPQEKRKIGNKCLNGQLPGQTYHLWFL